MTNRIDLHNHSTASDGQFSPRQVVEKAQANGVEIYALTDHDTVDGVAEAKQTAEELGIQFASGIEISADHALGGVHILGYFVNHHDEDFLSWLRQLKRWREERNVKILDNLRGQGIPVTEEDIVEQIGSMDRLESMGRPHMARILLKHGAVKDFNTAFDRFLGKNGSAYVDKKRVSPQEAVDQLHQAGGVVVLAHPFVPQKRDLPKVEAIVRELIDAGIDGLEAYHAEHTREQVEQCLKWAQANGLIVTGGSDYHGPDVTQGNELGKGYGSLYVPPQVWDDLQATRNRLHG